MQADVHAVQKASGNKLVDPEPYIEVEDLTEEDPARYLEGVQRILAYIREGDIFQANLSRAWQARLEGSVDALSLYAHLRAANPAPFAALVRLGQGAIVSSSPERLVRARGGVVETRPIAGTRPRSESIERDRAFARELLAHPKERAEHIMLIDLERNDLGRVCRPGTVRVDELMTLETYRHVHHIVSNVRGVLRIGITPGQVIAAVFPGGTITGCPKVRCMEILAELEAEGRGAYTGSVGYLGSDGDLDLNILIRSYTLSGNLLGFRAGAGIVADSIPERELEETRAKAEGLLRAIGAGAMA
jgi:anthranilate synthase component 1